MDSSHRLSIQGTALGHCSLPSLWAPHPEPGCLKHSPPPALHVHEAPVPLTAHPCRAPSHFTNEETEAPELNGERTVHSEAPRARSFFHHLLLVGLEEVSELGALGNLREREGGRQGAGGLCSPGTLILVGGQPGQTPWIPGRRKAKLVCPRGLMGKSQSRLGSPSQVSTAGLIVVTVVVVVIIIIKRPQCSEPCRGQLLAHGGWQDPPPGPALDQPGGVAPAVKGAGRRHSPDSASFQINFRSCLCSFPRTWTLTTPTPPSGGKTLASWCPGSSPRYPAHPWQSPCPSYGLWVPQGSGGRGPESSGQGTGGTGRLPCVLIICPLGPPTTVLGSHLGSFHLALGDTGSEHPLVGEGQGRMLHAHLVSTGCLHKTQSPSSNGPESL